MPVITVDWRQGNDRKRREDLVSELAATTSRVTGCPVGDVIVIVRDCESGRAAGLHWVEAGGFSEMGLGQGSPC